MNTPSLQTQLTATRADLAPLLDSTTRFLRFMVARTRKLGATPKRLGVVRAARDRRARLKSVARLLEHVERAAGLVAKLAADQPR